MTAKARSTQALNLLEQLALESNTTVQKDISALISNTTEAQQEPRSRKGRRKKGQATNSEQLDIIARTMKSEI